MLQLQSHNSTDLLLSQPFKDYDLIQPIDELRLEGTVDDLIHHAHSFLVTRGIQELLAAQIAGHDDHCVGKVDDPALAIGQSAVVEQLQEDVEYIRMRLLNLVEEDDRIRTPPDHLGQLSALVVSYIPRGSTDEAAYGEFLHVLAHVDAGQSLLIIKEQLGKHLGKQGLSNTRRTGEQECSQRLVLIGDARLIASDGVADCFDGLLLADHLL